ncbi:MAG TPA: hypothetical protein VGG39_24155 [Polyangiaceae bacterium]
MNDGTPGDRLRLVSHFPGRLRVRADTFRSAPAVTDEVLARLREEPAVTSTTSSALTGSILVLYDPEALQLPKLVQIIVVTGGLSGLEFDAANDWMQKPPTGDRLRGAIGVFNERMREATGGRMDGRVVVPAALLAGGLSLLFKRPMLPNWFDLTFWAYTTFNNMNPAKPPRRQPADGSADEA